MNDLKSLDDIVADRNVAGVLQLKCRTFRDHGIRLGVAAAIAVKKYVAGYLVVRVAKCLVTVNVWICIKVVLKIGKDRNIAGGSRCYASRTHHDIMNIIIEEFMPAAVEMEPVCIQPGGVGIGDVAWIVLHGLRDVVPLDEMIRSGYIHAVLAIAKEGIIFNNTVMAGGRQRRGSIEDQTAFGIELEKIIFNVAKAGLFDQNTGPLVT